MALLQSSSIDWTALRVGMLLNGAEPKPVRASLRKPQGQSINCGSLARFALQVAADGSFSRQAPFVSN